MYKGGSTQCGSRQDRTAIRFVQVGSHTCHVAYVIAYIIGNGGRVSRIVFGDSGFYLTHKVGAYVGSFCIYTATYTGKERLCGSSHTERQHRGSDYAKFMSRCQCVGGNHRIQQQIPERYIEQPQSDYYESHYRTTAESDSQSGVQ